MTTRPSIPTTLSAKELYLLWVDTQDVNYIAQLFEKYRARFRAQLLKKNIPDVDDVLQEGYIKIQAALMAGKYRQEQWQLSTWMFTVVWNNCLDILRKNKVAEQHNGPSLDALLGDKQIERLSDILQVVTDDGDVFGVDAEDIPSVVGLYHLVSYQNKKSRHIADVAIRYRLMGIKFEDIADLTRINVSTLRVKWHKTTRQMKELYAEGKRNPNFTQEHMLQIEEEGKRLKAYLQELKAIQDAN